MDLKLTFLCGARDFHAMDWYRSAQEVLPKERLSILTDLISGEGFKKLITDEDDVEKLLILDKILFQSQSRLGKLWRNFIKLLVMPLQVFLLKRYDKYNPNTIFYAHSMYYLWLAHYAKVKFIGTPQGSDILIKPFKSRIFKYLSVKALKSAKIVTVDSEMMKKKMIEIAGVYPELIQNGIDVTIIDRCLSVQGEVRQKRENLLSIRGLVPLYRIEELLGSRNKAQDESKFPISFIYPFFEKEYKEKVLRQSVIGDRDLGRLDRVDLYNILIKSKLVFSIPESDSSPRSVYEAIFCGSAVAISHHSYYDNLPKCMKERIIIVDLGDPGWFEKSIKEAEIIIQKKFVASEEALDVFDQGRCFTRILGLIRSKIV